MMINTIDFLYIRLMRQQCAWCIKSGMETKPAISHHREMTAVLHKRGHTIFVTLYAGLTQRG